MMDEEFGFAKPILNDFNSGEPGLKKEIAGERPLKQIHGRRVRRP
jgi:hypothetical protein